MDLSRTIRLAFFTSLTTSLLLSVTPLSAQEGELEGNELREILKKAKPAPTPPGGRFAPDESRSAPQRGLIEYDIRTRETIVVPGEAADSVGSPPPDPPRIPPEYLLPAPDTIEGDDQGR